MTLPSEIILLYWKGMLHLTLPGYILGSSPCHQVSTEGSVVITSVA